MGGAIIPGLMVTTPKGTAGKETGKESKGPEVFWTFMSAGRGQKRVKYQGDDTGMELEERTELETQEQEKLPGHRPCKIRRTLETPAREVSKEKQETFLQVFNRFMKARAPPEVEKGVRGPTPVKTKIKRI